jgi:hypothetical protein
MQHTARRAIETRLTKWDGAFDKGQWSGGWEMDCPPEARIDISHDYDVPAELAHASEHPHLIELAELVQLMAGNYILRMNNDMFDALIQDNEPERPVENVPTGQRVTVADIEAIMNR